MEVFPKTRDGTPKETVDVTITSPPYWNLKDYGCKSQIGYNQSYNLYLQDLEKIFADVISVTKETGSLWIIVNAFTKKDEDSSLLQGYEKRELVPLTFDVIRAVRNSGWKLRDILVWQKDKTLPWSRNGRLRSIFENILFFTKTSNYKFYTDRIRISDQTQFKEWWVKFPERYSPNGMVPTNLWYFPIPLQGSWASGYTRHFCPFPVSLVERILLLTTNKGSLVFDPFAGSGVVLAVAESMNRQAIGVELNPAYVERFRSHVLEDIKKEMGQLEIQRQKQVTRQRLLRRKINALRLTKFPRLLIKKLNLSPAQAHEINSIFAIASDATGGIIANWKDRLHENVYVIFDFKDNKDILEETANRLIRKPPLSKFGIEPTLCFLTKDSFIAKQCASPTFNHNELWLYLKGVTHRFHTRITFEEWINASKKEEWKILLKQNVPPIVSNIRIRQSVPSTWAAHQQ